MLPSLAINIPDLIFVLLGLPLAVQDSKTNSVSVLLLFPTYAIWLISALASGNSPVCRLFLSTIVLIIGALGAYFFPDRLGEADILFLSGMSAIFSYWSFVIAVALGCIGALSSFLWLSLKERKNIFPIPIPFLPSLYWGGVAVILRGWQS
jgi:hypothetical protein